MLNRVTLLFMVTVLLTSFSLAQTKAILGSDGKLYPVKQSDVVPLDKKQKSSTVTPLVFSGVKNSNNPMNLIDTLRIPAGSSANFIIYGQDVAVQWFEAPADLFVHKVGFAVGEQNNNTVGVEVKLVKSNWTKEQMMSIGTTWWGYYQAPGNGFNPEITAFADNVDRNGGAWVPVTAPPAGFPAEPWGADLWSDGGAGLPIAFADLVIDATNKTYNMIDLSLLAYPDVKKGEVFGIAVKNTSPTLGADRFLFWYNASVDLSAWKFYATDRGTVAGDYGWWSRDFSFDMIAEVELYGDKGPDINSFTELASTVDLGPFTVDANISDTNPGNPAAAGVATAVLQYSVDGGTTWTDVAMTGTEPNFTGQIPAQAANQWVTYQIVATDNNANSTTSLPVEFYLFAPSGAPTLVIFNGRPTVSGYPQNYYWGPAFRGANPTKGFAHDRWAYGAIPSLEFLNNYKNIFEICTTGPTYNDALISQWLAGDATRNYFLSGEEFLGDRIGYTDQDFLAGSFEYDILGVTHVYNDITYTGTGQNDPTKVTPLAGTAFGDPLLTLWNSYSPKPDSLMYHPYFELGEANWQDAFDVRDGITVDMNVETRGVGGEANVMTKPTMAHHVLPAGNKIVFMSFDPLALNTANSDAFAYYHWVGYTESAPPYQALLWFGIPTDVVSVKEVGGTPTSFELTQNYPNPFNPATTINFSIPKASNVTLKVYDVLGKEVATLLNAEKTAGNYQVNFDASKLTSGVYFYTLTTGDFSLTKKMMLMK